MTERSVNDQQSGTTCVILDGTLTVRGIDAVHARLTAALRQHSLVIVDSAAATEIDLSLIQLLLSARASATHAGRTLRLAAPAQGALLAALLAGGFLPDAPDAAFWNGSDVTP
jgi:anti-anti-sigma regulatory factor